VLGKLDAAAVASRPDLQYNWRKDPQKWVANTTHSMVASSRVYYEASRTSPVWTLNPFGGTECDGQRLSIRYLFNPTPLGLSRLDDFDRSTFVEFLARPLSHGRVTAVTPDPGTRRCARSLKVNTLR
jgi:hypothetical protein